MTYSDNYNIRTKNVKFNDVADAIDGSLTRSYGGVTTGTSTTYVTTTTPAWTSYEPGQLLVVIPHVNNAGACTINVSSLGAKAIKSAGNDLAAGDLKINTPIALIYNGTYFESLIIQNYLAKDGSNSMSADLNLGGFRIKNLSAGTAAAPSLYPGTDTNTGVFFPAADTWAVATNGVERLRVDSSGNASISSSSVATNASIFSAVDGATRSISFIPNLGAGGYNPISQATDFGFIFSKGPIGTGTLVIAPHSSTAGGIRIASNGFVGIGATSPSQMLDVNGSIVSNATISGTTISGTSGVFGAGTIGDGSTSSNLAFRNYNNSNLAWVASVRTDVGGVNQDLKFLRYTSAGTVYSGIAMQIQNSTGFVGIGTSSPDQMLTVSGNVKTLSDVVINNTSPTVYFQDTDHRSSMIHCNSNLLYVLRGDGTNSTTWAQYNGYWPLVINLENNDATFGGSLFVLASGTSACVGTTSTAPASGNVTGVAARAEGLLECSRAGNTVFRVNRKTNDGAMVEFIRDATSVGSISVASGTVSYNAFSGSHWSQLEDGDRQEILVGTVMETVDKMCEWPNEEEFVLPRVRISQSIGSTAIYGVFSAWDDDWTPTNDLYVTSLGAFMCRVSANVTVAIGDLLESNGDGTARVQSDGVIRQSTIGKVTSTKVSKKYDDGSYCVPTVLYCG